jgi:hypothetical protein
MDKKLLLKIKNDVLKKFPEFKGIAPKITTKAMPDHRQLSKKLTLGAGMAKMTKKITSMRFSKAVKTADNVKLERHLIVTMDENGEILKITESR